MIVRCDATAEWTAFRDPQTGYWIGECAPLGLVAEGETWAELQADSSAALELLLRHLLGTGELGHFLDQMGWHCEGVIPAGVRPEDVIFDVPAHIVTRPAPGQQFAAH